MLAVMRPCARSLRAGRVPTRSRVSALRTSLLLMGIDLPGALAARGCALHRALVEKGTDGFVAVNVDDGTCEQRRDGHDVEVLRLLAALRDRVGDQEPVDRRAVEPLD